MSAVTFSAHGGVDWTHLAGNTDRVCALVNTALNLRVAIKGADFPERTQKGICSTKLPQGA